MNYHAKSGATSLKIDWVILNLVLLACFILNKRDKNIVVFQLFLRSQTRLWLRQGTIDKEEERKKIFMHFFQTKKLIG